MLCCFIVYLSLNLPITSLKFLFIFYVVTLTPDIIVQVYCGGTQTFICEAPRKPLGWTITGLRGISIPGPFRPRVVAQTNPRIASNDTGGDSQVGVSNITISGFSASDNGGTIQCINQEDGSVQGMATIFIGISMFYPRLLC